MSEEIKRNPIGIFSEEYSKNPYLQALIVLVPGGSSLDVLCKYRADEIAKKRLDIFINELINCSFTAKEELIKKDEFLHCFFKTAKAATENYNTEKIKIFARLLADQNFNTQIPDIDEFETNYSIISELTVREIKFLLIIDNYEIKHPRIEDESALARCSKYWDTMIQEIEDQFDISIDEINAILTRLNRTGCYSTIIGMFNGNYGNKGYTTPLFQKFKKYLTSNKWVCPEFPIDITY